MILKFCKQWDKLSPEKFKVGNTFTTFRQHDKGKAKYYDGSVGEEFDVKINNNVIGKALLKDVDVKWSDQLTIKQMKEDTHEHWDLKDWNNLLLSFYKYTPIFGLFLTFEVTEVNNES